MSPTADFTCRHCGATRSRVRYEFAEHNKVIRECLGCRLMVLDPMPSEDELHAVYNEGYFENENLTKADPSRVYGYVDYISERINKQKATRGSRRAEETRCRRSRPAATRLGCGGLFLEQLWISSTRSIDSKYAWSTSEPLATRLRRTS